MPRRESLPKRWGWPRGTPVDVSGLALSGARASRFSSPLSRRHGSGAGGRPLAHAPAGTWGTNRAEVARVLPATRLAPARRAFHFPPHCVRLLAHTHPKRGGAHRTSPNHFVSVARLFPSPRRVRPAPRSGDGVVQSISRRSVTPRASWSRRWRKGALPR